ncbi:MAG: hypothetical protein ACKPCM_10810 [Pseudanabaena sp.]
MQLDIFSIVPDYSVRELPKAIAPVDPKAEKALAVLVELKKLECKPELVEGCTVRSNLFFKGKTAKVICLKQIHTITLATVEFEFKGSLIRFPCGVSALEVVK